MTIIFEKATKRRARARIALDGPAGSGKTMSALRIARGLAGPEGKIAVIDTERGSASLYADKIDGGYDVLELQSFSPDNYVAAIGAAVEAGYSVVVIDSLSHAWEGKDGALDMKDRAERRTGNSWTAWREVTPAHNRLVESMLQCPAHVVATMRSRMEHVLELDEKTKKNVVRKVGLAPIQRPGMEYEFSLIGDIDQDHRLIVSKTRCDAFDHAVIDKPGEDFGRKLLAWLNEGAPEKVASGPHPDAIKGTVPLAGGAVPVSQPSAPPPAQGTATERPKSDHGVGLDFGTFAQRLRYAPSRAALEGIGSEIAFAASNGLVTAAEREMLRELYGKRTVEIVVEATAA
jgi:hypothetical protein